MCTTIEKSQTNIYVRYLKLENSKLLLFLKIVTNLRKDDEGVPKI